MRDRKGCDLKRMGAKFPASATLVNGGLTRARQNVTNIDSTGLHLQVATGESLTIRTTGGAPQQ
jgi:hypothetical protein